MRVERRSPDPARWRGDFETRRVRRPALRFRSSFAPLPLCAFALTSGPVKQFDYLVLGSGIAGLSFALKVAPHGRVAIVTKKDRAESNTNYAQGGIAAVTGKDDSFELHVRDTLTAGAGL